MTKTTDNNTVGGTLLTMIIISLGLIIYFSFEEIDIESYKEISQTNSSNCKSSFIKGKDYINNLTFLSFKKCVEEEMRTEIKNQEEQMVAEIKQNLLGR